VPARTGYGEWASDGIDLTPEMLERARAKSLYRSLFLGSVEETGISHARYDLRFVIVGMHPFFFMTGMPTHFKDSDGVVDEEWLRTKPKWQHLRNYPVNFGYLWQRNSRRASVSECDDSLHWCAIEV
jgi:hypothetical protein